MNRKIIPLFIFGLLVALVAVPLLQNKNPKSLPSVLLRQPAPRFSLDGFSDKDLRQGDVSIVNFFASWCLPCAAEQPLLEGLAQQENIAIYGIAYKDKKEKIDAWLKENGNPFRVVAHDTTGRVAIDWGVYGVPETFIVDGKGTVLFRQPGPLTKEVIKDEVLPIIRLRQ
jgi:cytochrome c biogenesis protein CcmG/thiol:disulfide interchange protein DsbE